MYVKIVFLVGVGGLVFLVNSNDVAICSYSLLIMKIHWQENPLHLQPDRPAKASTSLASASAAAAPLLQNTFAEPSPRPPPTSVFSDTTVWAGNVPIILRSDKKGVVWLTIEVVFDFKIQDVSWIKMINDQTGQNICRLLSCVFLMYFGLASSSS